MTLKRFVIRKSLIGKNEVITFVNKKGDKVKYNHDEVYNAHKERFEAVNCFAKYKSYTNTNNMPAFCRDLQITN
jgi:predicted membrane GTPase involved in stress response